MQNRLKHCALVMCLFVFLFVTIGGGLHLAPAGAFLAAVTGTPLMIHAFRRRFGRDSRAENRRSNEARNEVAYVSSKTSHSHQ